MGCLTVWPWAAYRQLSPLIASLRSLYPMATHARARLGHCQLGKTQTAGQAGEQTACSPVARQTACSLLTLVLSGAMGTGPRWILGLVGGGVRRHPGNQEKALNPQQCKELTLHPLPHPTLCLSSQTQASLGPSLHMSTFLLPSPNPNTSGKSTGPLGLTSM